jgi:membrane associated rhomboid family serine protease
MHLAGNMLYLWIFGNNVEDTLGRGRFTLFYLLSGLAATVAQVAVQPDSTIPMVGASGAIAGVLGAYFLVFPSARVTTLIFFIFIIRVVKIPAGLVLGVWLILQMMSAASNQPGVAWFAHIGGFLAGMGLLFFMSARSSATRIRGRERY